MSFVFDFTNPQDTVHFAYSIPYTYSRLLKFLSNLPLAQAQTSLKSLSGLPIPLLEITDESEPQYNKQTVLVTARIHPGQANSSFVVEGFLDYLCSNQGMELRKNYLFYVIPMINPDGVVAGNYRTSLFGKDLNRTFDQSRKFAFPETYMLVEFAKQLKATHKRRFNLYLDLHGHSVKKNVFMYGPDFGIQHSNYQLSRELPRLLGNVTSLFRYYSCLFRITGQKAKTARAIMNRQVGVPFTYTMQASSGFYFDGVTKTECPFTAQKYKEMGVYLCKALELLQFDQAYRIKKVATQSIVKDSYQPQSEKESDDEISQGGSDSQPEEQDLSQQELLVILRSIEGRQTQTKEKEPQSATKVYRFRHVNSRELKPKKERPNVFLPPINSLNRASIFTNRNQLKQAMRQERLRQVQSQAERPSERTRRLRYSASQIEPQQEVSYNVYGRYKRQK